MRAHFCSEGEYIAAGSDDGCIFIWDRESGNIVRILRADSSTVNCVQPHPTDCLIASSGIDSVVRIWTPQPEVSLRLPSPFSVFSFNEIPNPPPFPPSCRTRETGRILWYLTTSRQP